MIDDKKLIFFYLTIKENELYWSFKQQIAKTTTGKPIAPAVNKIL